MLTIQKEATVATDVELLEGRQNRIEDAIERLTEISSDLNKMIAVHDQRLLQQEKQMSSLEVIVEKRREEGDLKLKDVYETIRNEDRVIIIEINKMREEAQSLNEKLSTRIKELEKLVWTLSGAVSVIVFIINYGTAILKMLGKM